MESRYKTLGAAFGAMLLSSPIMGQIAYPDFVVQGQNWHTGTHHYAVTQHILSPGTPAAPVNVEGSANVEFVSGTQVRLTDGFHAGSFSNGGQFHAYIDQTLGVPGDVVVITPDPATHVQDNVLHVNKWEKLEIGLQLPQDYKDAIDRFIAHYYADPNDPYVSTPANVDPVHDLNPYADDSLQLVLTLTRPDGSQLLRWGFFMREAKWESNLPTARLVEDPDDPLHPYAIRFRLAPDMEGPWQFTLSLQAPYSQTLGGSLSGRNYTGYAFACDPPLPDNHGPMHVNAVNRRTLEFEDGTAFFGLGTNLESTGSGLGWWDPNSYRLVLENFNNVDQALSAMGDANANFARIWLMDKGLAPENVNLGVYDRFTDALTCGGIPVVTGNCQYQCWALDQYLKSARQQGEYFQLTIVPYPLIIDYETFAWHNDAYLNAFVEPRDPVTGLYDLKRYFYSNGDPATANVPGSGFYFWKRKYKYIMSRWGWSVNIPIIEPFNEVDQMLSYRHVDRTDYWTPMGGQYPWAICAENRLDWVADPALPAIYSQWLTDIIGFVKGEQDLTDPVHGPLGFSSKLFLAGTGPEDNNNPNWSQPNNPNWNLPNRNPSVDLVDVHNGLFWGEGELSGGFDKSMLIRNAYTNSADGTKRPFHQGESNYYQLVDIDPGSETDTKDVAGFLDNYDVSFHNELWASTFFGNFAAATTWQKERVFWWGVHTPPDDPNNLFQVVHSGTQNAWNTLDIGIEPAHIQYPLQNRTVYHNFKPLADLLANPNWQSYGFFNGEFAPHKAYDDANKIECYYLVNGAGTMAIGWVHNLNAYWENHYYARHLVQNFRGCASPNVQGIALTGFQTGLDYHVTYFPTRMNMTELPDDAVDETQTGTVTLDLSTPLSAQLNGLVNNYLDTLHSDYAFIVALSPVHRNMAIAQDTASDEPNWDVGLYPNPASDALTLVFPDEGPFNISVQDPAGRLVCSWHEVSGPLVHLSVDKLARGAYTVRVADGGHCQVKQLIIR